jgi:hypothetical protein
MTDRSDRLAGWNCRRGISLVDLLSTTGIRVGEALSLFTADLHFGGGSRQLGVGFVTCTFMCGSTIQWRTGRVPKVDRGRCLFIAIGRELRRLRAGTPEDKLLRAD